MSKPTDRDFEVCKNCGFFRCAHNEHEDCPPIPRNTRFEKKGIGAGAIRPGEPMSIIEYVTEEVRRQGHDIYALDGIQRVGWMLSAWAYALEDMQDAKFLTMLHIRTIGMRVEEEKNSNGFRKVGVRVGMRICPPAREVQDRLKRLLEMQKQMTPLEFYKEFELIHPFVDGNGRTGKVLLNWMNGSLLYPIFPPADIFGEPIRNP